MASAVFDQEAHAASVGASTEAVHRINADKRSYLHYYKRDCEGYPEVHVLTLDDLNLGRI